MDITVGRLVGGVGLVVFMVWMVLLRCIFKRLPLFLQGVAPVALCSATKIGA